MRIAVGFCPHRCHELDTPGNVLPWLHRGTVFPKRERERDETQARQRVWLPSFSQGRHHAQEVVHTTRSCSMRPTTVSHMCRPNTTHTLAEGWARYSTQTRCSLSTIPEQVYLGPTALVRGLLRRLSVGAPTPSRFCSTLCTMSQKHAMQSATSLLRFHRHRPRRGLRWRELSTSHISTQFDTYTDGDGLPYSSIPTRSCRTPSSSRSPKSSPARARGPSQRWSCEACRRPPCGAPPTLTLCSVHLQPRGCQEVGRSHRAPQTTARTHGAIGRRFVGGGDFNMAVNGHVAALFNEEFVAPGSSLLWGIGGLDEAHADCTGFPNMPPRPCHWCVNRHGRHQSSNEKVGRVARDQGPTSWSSFIFGRPTLRGERGRSQRHAQRRSADDAHFTRSRTVRAQRQRKWEQAASSRDGYEEGGIIASFCTNVTQPTRKQLSVHVDRCSSLSVTREHMSGPCTAQVPCKLHAFGSWITFGEIETALEGNYKERA